MSNGKKIAIWFGGASGLLLLIYFSLAGMGLAPTQGTRFTETKMSVRNLAGADFEVTYTNADTLAKEEFISVYASNANEGKTSWLRRIFVGKTLLFRYDPAMVEGTLPTITSSGPRKINISIPRISSVIFQREKWGNLSINYDIGRIDYPTGTSASQRAH